MAPKITKEKASCILGNAPEDKAFWINNGNIIKNLKQLSDALAKMPQKKYSYHANEKKNDFVSWISQVFGDDTLAAQLKKIKEPKTASKKIKARISYLSKRFK